MAISTFHFINAEHFSKQNTSKSCGTRASEFKVGQFFIGEKSVRLLCQYHTRIIRVSDGVSYAYQKCIICVLYEYHTRIKSVSYAYQKCIIRVLYEYQTSIIRVSKVYHTRIIRVSNGVSYACYTSMIRVLYEYYTRTIRKNVKKYVSGTVHIGMELTCADITGVDTKIIHYTKPRTNASFG